MLGFVPVIMYYIFFWILTSFVWSRFYSYFIYDEIEDDSAYEPRIRW